MRTAVGIDVGATKIAAGRVDLERGVVLAVRRTPTLAHRGPRLVLDDCLTLAAELAEGEAVSAVGLAVCELIDPAGRVRSCETIDWRALDVAGELGRIAPACVESDVRAAALAEGRFGAARGEPDFLYVSVGSGISHCLVADGRPRTGVRGSAIGTGAPLVERWSSGCAIARRTGHRDAEAALADPAAEATIEDAARRLGLVLAALVNALDDTAILGLTTNLGFLRALAASDAFRDAAIDTAWLDSHPDAFVLETPIAAWCLAAWSLATAHDSDARHPFGVADGWRSGSPPAAVPIELTNGADLDDTRVLTVDVAGGRIVGPSATVEVRSLSASSARVRLEIDGVAHEGQVLVGPREVLVAYQGQTYALRRPDAFGPDGRTTLSDGSVSAPMPGTVLAVNVTVGAVVVEGQTMAVMEAMKMELALKAPITGTVTDVDVVVGDQVDRGARLFAVAPPGEPTGETAGDAAAGAADSGGPAAGTGR